MADELNPKHQRFAEEYAATLGNGTEAYCRVYGTTNRASARANAARLLAKDNVWEAVEEARRKMAEKAGLTPEWIIERLQTNVARAMQAEPVLDRKGDETGQYTYQGAVANRALELLGKHLRMFGDTPPPAPAPAPTTSLDDDLEQTARRFGVALAAGLTAGASAGHASSNGHQEPVDT